jgi:hypothetical protein
METQFVGPCRSSLIFLPLSGSLGISLNLKTWQGFVRYFMPPKPISTPFFSDSMASEVMSPSTYA